MLTSDRRGPPNKSAAWRPQQVTAFRSRTANRVHNSHDHDFTNLRQSSAGECRVAAESDQAFAVLPRARRSISADWLVAANSLRHRDPWIPGLDATSNSTGCGTRLRLRDCQSLRWGCTTDHRQRKIAFAGHEQSRASPAYSAHLCPVSVPAAFADLRQE